MDSVYEYIKSEIIAWKIDTVELDDNWKWNMRDHIRKSFLYKNSKFFDGQNDGERPFDNIILSSLLVQYRTEGFDVKDIVPYVNDEKNYHKSFFVKKYHPRWARKNNLDTFIDELVESYVDYGLALVKEVNGVKPVVIDLRKIAFCDQSDATRLICLEHNYTPSELKEETGWYQDEIDRVILLNSKDPKEKKKNIIKVYELHGELPESWLVEGGDKYKYVRQMQIIAFYKDKDKNKGGICLYKGKSKQLFKALKRDDTGLKDRACGRGAIEESFDPQVWVNYDAIQVKEMLDIASLMLIQTADKTAAQRQKVTELSKGEILYHEEGKPFNQVVLRPLNKAEFERNSQKWEQRARLLSSADETLLGLNPSSGTPLGTTQIVTSQNLGIHEYRQGKISTFVAELYRDYILRYLVKDINKGQKFLEELSLDELEEISEKIAINQSNSRIKEIVLNLKPGDVTPERIEMLRSMKDLLKGEFKKGGAKRFIDIIKDEIKDIPIDVEVNIKNKQKDLAEVNQKLSNIVRTFISDPRFQNEDMGKILLELFETAGLSPLNFSSFGKVFTARSPQPMQSKPELEAEPATI